MRVDPIATSYLGPAEAEKVKNVESIMKGVAMRLRRERQAGILRSVERHRILLRCSSLCTSNTGVRGMLSLTCVAGVDNDTTRTT